MTRQRASAGTVDVANSGLRFEPSIHGDAESFDYHSRARLAP